MISGTDVRGNRLANAPARTLNVSGEWVAVDSDVARLVLRADVSAVSSQYFEILNIPRLRSPGYALVGASATVSRGPWSVAVWGKNLGDTFYFTSRIDLSGFGFDYAHVGTPRMFGASLRYDFR